MDHFAHIGYYFYHIRFLFFSFFLILKKYIHFNVNIFFIGSIKLNKNQEKNKINGEIRL